MRITLTEKQLKVLRFFRDFQRERGLAPTLDEASHALGISRITVHEHLRHLEEKRAVRRTRGKARAVEVVYDPDDPDGSARATTLPVLGTIAAGRPIEALEDREEIDIREIVPCGAGHYLLRVRGKSMIEDHIDDGDLVVVESARTARNGQIVVALLPDGEATLKRYFRENGRIRLQPANSSMEPIYPEAVEIQGIVRGVVRRL